MAYAFNEGDRSVTTGTRGLVDFKVLARFGLVATIGLTAAHAGDADRVTPTPEFRPGLWQMTLDGQKEGSLFCVSADPKAIAAETSILSLIAPPQSPSENCTQTVTNPRQNEVSYKVSCTRDGRSSTSEGSIVYHSPTYRTATMIGVDQSGQDVSQYRIAVSYLWLGTDCAPAEKARQAENDAYRAQAPARAAFYQRVQTEGASLVARDPRVIAVTGGTPSVGHGSSVRGGSPTSIPFVGLIFKATGAGGEAWARVKISGSLEAPVLSVEAVGSSLQDVGPD